MLSYQEVLPQLLLIINQKTCVVIAPFELAFLSYLAYLGPPLSTPFVVVP
jgi:hypothetical protein